MGEMAPVRTTLPAPTAAGRLPVDVYTPREAPRGLALVAHGRSGSPDQPHMQPVVRACLGRGLKVVAPHLPNSPAGEGAGRPDRFTMAGQIEALGHVSDWARASLSAGSGCGMLLVGHSMGAHAALRLAAEAAPGEIAGVLAISPVVSGAALIAARARMGAEALEALRDEVPGAFAEWRGHDLIAPAHRIAVPVALMTGAEDGLTPPCDMQTLAARLPLVVSLEILPGQHHCPTGADYARRLGAALERVIAAGRRR